MAAAVFNGTYLVIAIFFSILWHHAVRSGLLDAATLESANSISRQYAIGPLAYLACLGLTWISIPGSIAGNVILAVFFAVPPKTQRNTQLAMHSATK